MMTQDEIQEIAKQYAYDMVTSPNPDANTDIDSVLELWNEGKHHDDVYVWEPFENKSPHELLDVYDMFESAFLNFAKEIKG